MKKRPGIWIAGGALLLGTFGLSGCATKRYVGEEVSKSSAASEKRINEVESQVETAQSKIRDHDTRITELDKSTRDALERAQAAGKLAEGKFVYSLVLSDDAVKFPTSTCALSKEAEAKLAEFAEKLKAENKNVYLEIQGHTDSTGSSDAQLQAGRGAGGGGPPLSQQAGHRAEPDVHDLLRRG